MTRTAGAETQSQADPLINQGTEPMHAEKAWVLAAVLSAIMTAAYLDRTIMAFLLEPIKTDLGLTDVQVSLLIGVAYSLFYAVTNIMAGAIVDRVDRRRLLLVTGFLWSTASIACGLSSTYWQLLVARMVLGGAEAFIGPSVYALLRDRVPGAKRGSAFSVLGMAPYIGGAGAYILGGVLLRQAMAGDFAGLPLIGALAPWQIVIVAVGILSFLPVLLLFLIEGDGRRARPHHHEAGFAAAYRYVRTHAGPYAIIIGYGTTGTMIALGANSWVATMVHRSYGIPLPEVGAIVGPLGLVFGLIGLALCGHILDRMEKSGRRIGLFALVSCLVSAGGMAIMPQFPHAWQAWVAYCVANLSTGAFFPIGASLLARITPAALMGKLTSLFLLFQSMAASMIGITLVAVLAENLFTGKMALGNAITLYCAVLGIIAAVLSLVLDRAAAVGKVA